jgi:hypothetical protein
MTKEMVLPQLKQAYEALSPDGPDHLDAVLDKVLPLWNTDLAFSFSDLERVAAPTLVLAADDDITLSRAVGARRAHRLVRPRLGPAGRRGSALTRARLARGRENRPQGAGKPNAASGGRGSDGVLVQVDQQVQDVAHENTTRARRATLTAYEAPRGLA